MRSTIKKTDIAYPNEKFVCIHLINFTIWTVLFSAYEVMRIVTLKEEAKLDSLPPDSEEHNLQNLIYLKIKLTTAIIHSLDYTAFFYTNCFFLFMIGRLSRESRNSETFDPILGRKVPSIVFIQNQKLLQESLKRKLDLDEFEKKFIYQSAESNETVHRMLREVGVSTRLDEDIGIEFIDMSKPNTGGSEPDRDTTTSEETTQNLGEHDRISESSV